MSALPQFDVAAALYREPPVPLYYLDHDPVAAAQAAADMHVALGLGAAVKALSAAWHVHNVMTHNIDDKLPYGHLLTRRTPPASYTQATLQARGPDPLYKESPSEQSYYLLCGQRIGGPSPPYPVCDWTASSADNYAWVWAHGLALCVEHQHRWRVPHTLTPALWSLEHVPPELPSGLTAPTPDVPADCAVIVDGCYDTPASYRAHYVAHKQALLKWTKRAPPSWLVFDETERLYTLRNSV